jgi:RNA polymerase sigma-70 factor (ECF subfamily)
MTGDIRTELVALLPRLRRFGLSLARSRERADDLVQAACERALRSEDSYEPGTCLDSWMFRIMRNLWIDEMRKAKTQGPHDDVDDSLDLAGDDGVKTAELRSEANAVEQAILRLPEEFRSVLLLVCVDELSYREAADVLGIPIGTVMSRLARARRAVANDLGLQPGQRAYDAGE